MVELPRVLVVMAVHAQQLPVAAVGRVVVVVVVAVVDRQFLHVGAGELARAAAADPRVHLQRPLAVAFLALGGRATRVGDDAVEAGIVGRGHHGAPATCTPSATIRYSTGCAGMPLPLSLLRCSTCSGVSSLRSSTPWTTAAPRVFLGR